MAHVQLRTGSAATNGHTVELIVDGVDITTSVLHDGFSIAAGEGKDPELVVTIPIAAGDIDVDLPDAVIKAVQA